LYSYWHLIICMVEKRLYQSASGLVKKTYLLTPIFFSPLSVLNPFFLSFLLSSTSSHFLPYFFPLSVRLLPFSFHLSTSNFVPFCVQSFLISFSFLLSFLPPFLTFFFLYSFHLYFLISSCYFPSFFGPTAHYRRLGAFIYFPCICMS